MKNKEREKLIKRLCKIQLKHDKKLERVYKLFNENGEIFGAEVDGCFIYEMFSIELIKIVLDLMSLNIIRDKLIESFKSELNTEDNKMFIEDEILKPIIHKVLDQVYPYIMWTSLFFMFMFVFIMIILFLNIQVFLNT